MNDTASSPDRSAQGRCAYPWQQMIIDLTGEVVPCCFWSGYGNSGKPLGNTNQNTLDEIWNGPEYAALREANATGLQPGHPCHECVAFRWGNGNYPRFEWPATPAPESGFAYLVQLPEKLMAELAQTPQQVQVLEDGVPLPIADALHDDIRRLGEGRYSVWKGYLYLSASDNSDPRTNGRRYALRAGERVFDLPTLAADSASGRNLLRAHDEYRAGASTMTARPSMISLISTADCNIDCPGCSQNLVRLTRVQHRAETVPDVLAHVPYLQQFIWHGGEPFLIKRFRDFINDFDPADNPNLTFGFTSNGTMLTARELEKLGKFPRINASISVDSFRRETFERIRKGASYERVMQHLFEALRFADPPRRVISVGMIVCKSNFLELADNLAFAIEHDIGLNLSPVVIYPVTERLDVFTDFKRDTAGWEAALMRAKGIVAQAIADERLAMRRVNPLGMLDGIEAIYLQAHEAARRTERLRIRIQDPHGALARMRNPCLAVIERDGRCRAYVLLDHGAGDYSVMVPQERPDLHWSLLSDVLEEGSRVVGGPLRIARTWLERLNIEVPPFAAVERPPNSAYVSYGETTPDGLHVIRPLDIGEAYDRIKAIERARVPVAEALPTGSSSAGR